MVILLGCQPFMPQGHAVGGWIVPSCSWVLGMAPKEQFEGWEVSHCSPLPPRARGRCGHTGYWVRGKTPKSSEPGGSGGGPSTNRATNTSRCLES